jgi:hypothetical protein
LAAKSPVRALEIVEGLPLHKPGVEEPGVVHEISARFVRWGRAGGKESGNFHVAVRVVIERKNASNLDGQAARIGNFELKAARIGMAGRKVV